MLVAFTGAGISVPSGLPTFEGSYRGIPIREILERDFFYSRTKFFYDFYRDVLLGWLEAQPNEAHRAIAQTRCPVVTQNIDGLHQRAGSTNTVELHGNLRELACDRCGKISPSTWARADTLKNGIPVCTDRQCGGILKPVVVLFGEGLPTYDEAYELMSRATKVLVVGTSLMVQPAAGLVEMASSRGADVVIVNERADTDVPIALRRLSHYDGAS